VQGQAPVSAGYIELKHSKQPDPAIRREQIIRAGAGMQMNSAATETVSSTNKVIACVQFDFKSRA